MSIELNKIVHVLKKHPAVNEGVVFLNDDDPKHPHLVAYVVFAAKAHATDSELREFLLTELPNHLIPASFLSLKALALTPKVKNDRQRIKVRK